MSEEEATGEGLKEAVGGTWVEDGKENWERWEGGWEGGRGGAAVEAEEAP